MRKYCIIVKRVQYLRFLFEAARKESAAPPARGSARTPACRGLSGHASASAGAAHPRARKSGLGKSGSSSPTGYASAGATRPQPHLTNEKGTGT